MARIGIYAGTFDPVHAGHIAFALQSIEAAGLDRVYFMPERQPRGKPGSEHFAHRMAMLERALKPHKRLYSMETEDINFTPGRILPRLHRLFPGDSLVMLFGSDIAKSIEFWPNYQAMLKEAEIIIGLRNSDKRQDIKKIIEAWPVQPPAVYLFKSHAPGISSSKIREALRKNRPAEAEGGLKSVERYSNKHWLYVSFDRA